MDLQLTWHMADNESTIMNCFSVLEHTGIYSEGNLLLELDPTSIITVRGGQIMETWRSSNQGRQATCVV
jgi:hypothetical protein